MASFKTLELPEVLIDKLLAKRLLDKVSGTLTANTYSFHIMFFSMPHTILLTASSCERGLKTDKSRSSFFSLFGSNRH